MFPPFQSPIPRGDGCDGPDAAARPAPGPRFQSPIPRGDGCDFRGCAIAANSASDLSVPYSSGRWVRRFNSCSNLLLSSLSVPYSSGRWVRPLPVWPGRLRPSALSVPYSSGRWVRRHPGPPPHQVPRHRFQSPIPRGDGCDNYAILTRHRLGPHLSVPYSSGRWVRLKRAEQKVRDLRSTFSPLFLGEMGATTTASRSKSNSDLLSVPYSSGRWVRLAAPAGRIVKAVPLSVPYSSGRWVRLVLKGPTGAGKSLSVPYSSGRWVRQTAFSRYRRRAGVFQSPIPRGDGCDG